MLLNSSVTIHRDLWDWKLQITVQDTAQDRFHHFEYETGWHVWIDFFPIYWCLPQKNKTISVLKKYLVRGYLLWFWFRYLEQWHHTVLPSFQQLLHRRDFHFCIALFPFQSKVRKSHNILIVLKSLYPKYLLF